MFVPGTLVYIWQLWQQISGGFIQGAQWIFHAMTATKWYGKDTRTVDVSIYERSKIREWIFVDKKQKVVKNIWVCLGMKVNQNPVWIMMPLKDYQVHCGIPMHTRSLTEIDWENYIFCTTITCLSHLEICYQMVSLLYIQKTYKHIYIKTWPVSFPQTEKTHYANMSSIVA